MEEMEDILLALTRTVKVNLHYVSCVCTCPSSDCWIYFLGCINTHGPVSDARVCTWVGGMASCGTQELEDAVRPRSPHMAKDPQGVQTVDAPNEATHPKPSDGVAVSSIDTHCCHAFLTVCSSMCHDDGIEL